MVRQPCPVRRCGKGRGARQRIANRIPVLPSRITDDRVSPCDTTVTSPSVPPYDRTHEATGGSHEAAGSRPVPRRRHALSHLLSGTARTVAAAPASPALRPSPPTVTRADPVPRARRVPCLRAYTRTQQLRISHHPAADCPGGEQHEPQRRPGRRRLGRGPHRRPAGRDRRGGRGHLGVREEPHQERDPDRLDQGPPGPGPPRLRRPAPASRSCSARRASATTRWSSSTAATTTGSRRTPTGTSSRTATRTSSSSTAAARSGSWTPAT